jgi:hypothetical protein
VGWRPPLAWRQTELWNQLGLPGAAAPLVWPGNDGKADGTTDHRNDGTPSPGGLAPTGAH